MRSEARSGFCQRPEPSQFHRTDQARPLAISISTLIRNRPPDWNPASLVLTLLADGTPRRVGKRDRH